MTHNPARPPPGVTLCGLEEIADPGAKGFRFREGEAMFAGLVVRQGEAVRGYVDRCPHAGWPLGAGWGQYLTRDERHILCGGHGALFRLEDGACIAGPCHGERLEAWPLELEDGVIVTARAGP